MTIQNRKARPTSRRERSRPDRTLLTVRESADDRLYWDCATVGLMIETDRPPAGARVEMMVGDQLARVLLAEAAIRPRATDEAPSTNAA
jgi:hypothetical protein